MMKLTSKEFLITRCHQLTKSLEIMQSCDLESDDSDNDVYDDDEFEAESQVT